MKFAANNRYATDTCDGFYNTWFVLAFEDKKSRDDYVANAKGMAVRPIAKASIRFYVKAPKPFTGERRAICLAAAEWPGLIGEVCVCTTNDANYLREL